MLCAWEAGLPDMPCPGIWLRYFLVLSLRETNDSGGVLKKWRHWKEKKNLKQGKILCLYSRDKARVWSIFNRENYGGNHKMSSQKLIATAKAMVADDKGLLAIDESTPTIG